MTNTIKFCEIQVYAMFNLLKLDRTCGMTFRVQLARDLKWLLSDRLNGSSECC